MNMEDRVMQFKENTTVLAADGEKVGEVSHVVVNPRNDEVSYLVIEEGFLYNDARMVPMDQVATASGERVTLRQPATALDLPRYEGGAYLALDELDQPTAGRAYPTGFARPIIAYPPVESAEEEPITIDRPDQGMELKEGARVISTDDEHVGDVARIFADSRSDRLTHLLISKGLLFTRDKLVPVAWVKSANADEVHLAVTSNALKNLPEYEN
jgi:uncharacterized protein YrrD